MIIQQRFARIKVHCLFRGFMSYLEGFIRQTLILSSLAAVPSTVAKRSAALSLFTRTFLALCRTRRQSCSCHHFYCTPLNILLTPPGEKKGRQLPRRGRMTCWKCVVMQRNIIRRTDQQWQIMQFQEDVATVFCSLFWLTHT